MVAILGSVLFDFDMARDRYTWDANSKVHGANMGLI